MRCNSKLGRLNFTFEWNLIELGILSRSNFVSKDYGHNHNLTFVCVLNPHYRS